jgi:hypothetical protein
MNWKLVLDEDAFQFVISKPAAQRRKLLDLLEHLRQNPRRSPDYQSQDVTGRTLFVWATRPFLITYWLDAYVSEVRIVNIQAVRF